MIDVLTPILQQDTMRIG